MHLNAFFIVSLLVQVGLIVHVVKTGRNFLWMAAIGFLPIAGSLAYIVVELLPELFGGRTARRAGGSHMTRTQKRPRFISLTTRRSVSR